MSVYVNSAFEVCAGRGTCMCVCYHVLPRQSCAFFWELCLHWDPYSANLWWFYPAGQLNSTKTTLSFPLPRGKRGENIMEKAQGLRQGRGGRSAIIATDKTDSE